jgi:hypothetical protein
MVSGDLDRVPRSQRGLLDLRRHVVARGPRPRGLFVPPVIACPVLDLLRRRFFSVALAGAAAEAIDGGEPSFSDGVDVAWTRLGGIAGWAGYSLFVALVLELVKSIKGLRWLGVAAQVAWELRNDLCRPADRARRFRLSERRFALVPARKGELARRVRRTRRLAGDAPPTWAAVLPGWEAAFRRACALTRPQGAAWDRAALRVRRVATASETA